MPTYATSTVDRLASASMPNSANVSDRPTTCFATANELRHSTYAERTSVVPATVKRYCCQREVKIWLIFVLAVAGEAAMAESCREIAAKSASSRFERKAGRCGFSFAYSDDGMAASRVSCLLIAVRAVVVTF